MDGEKIVKKKRRNTRKPLNKKPLMDGKDLVKYVKAQTQKWFGHMQKKDNKIP